MCGCPKNKVKHLLSLDKKVIFAGARLLMYQMVLSFILNE